RHTATTGAGPTSTHSGPGAILPTCGLAQPLEYLLSSLSAQQDLDDCAIGLATIDLSASAPLCQSPVFRFSEVINCSGELSGLLPRNQVFKSLYASIHP